MILPPGVFILLFLLFKKYRKIFFILLALFWLFSTEYIANRLLEPLERDCLKSSTIEAEAVVVLGGGYIKNSPNLQLESDSYKRFIYAIMLAKKDKLPIIFDGSKEEAIAIKNSVDELNRFLKINLPISKDKKYKKEFIIYIQNNALTTIDNAKNVQKFFQYNSIKNPKFYLVTSAYHMKRSVKEFKREKLNPTPKATDFKVSDDFNLIYFMPTAKGLNKSFLALHEYLANLRDFILQR